MKKLINRPEDVVREMLEGVVALSPATALLGDENIVVQARLPEDCARKVALISGGGSGHEPAHAGYVGPGMLTAAVAGDVFTSPSADAVLTAIRAVGGPAGVLLIVKNYTGDRLNFGLAAEMAVPKGYRSRLSSLQTIQHFVTRFLPSAAVASPAPSWFTSSPARRPLRACHLAVSQRSPRLQ